MNEFWRSTCVGGKKERQVWGLKVKTGLTGRRSSWAEYIYRMTFLRIRLLSNWVPVAPWHPHPPVVGDLCGEAAVLCSHHKVHFRCLYFTKVFPFYAEYFTLVLHYITEWSTVLLTPLDLFQQHWKGLILHNEYFCFWCMYIQYILLPMLLNMIMEFFCNLVFLLLLNDLIFHHSTSQWVIVTYTRTLCNTKHTFCCSSYN